MGERQIVLRTTVVEFHHGGPGWVDQFHQRVDQQVQAPRLATEQNRFPLFQRDGVGQTLPGCAELSGHARGKRNCRGLLDGTPGQPGDRCKTEQSHTCAPGNSRLPHQSNSRLATVSQLINRVELGVRRESFAPQRQHGQFQLGGEVPPDDCHLRPGLGFFGQGPLGCQRNRVGQEGAGGERQSIHAIRPTGIGDVRARGRRKGEQPGDVDAIGRCGEHHPRVEMLLIVVLGDDRPLGCHQLQHGVDW